MERNKLDPELIEKAKEDVLGVVSKYIELTKKGSEFTANCPFHSERTPSFTVNPVENFYYCFGCGAGGDAIGFVMDYESIGFREAVNQILGQHIIVGRDNTSIDRKSLKAAASDEWAPITPIPNDLKQKPGDLLNRRKGDGWETLTVSRRWAYRDADGELLGYVCRFDLPGGGKDVMPQTWCVNKTTGEARWRWLSFNKPRPLYGLDKLAAHRNAQVIIAEGEKAADAGQSWYETCGIPRDKLIVISWPGGGKAVKHADWSVLTDRNVGLWPDADLKPYVPGHARAGELMPFVEQPGSICMRDIAQRLEGVARSVKVIMPPEGVADGWDLADEPPEGFNLLQHSKAASIPVADFLAMFAPTPTAEIIELHPAETNIEENEYRSADGAPMTDEELTDLLEDDDEDDDRSDTPSTPENNRYFTILGYDHGAYYIFNHGTRQIARYTARDFSEISLIELAPIRWWEFNFGGDKPGSIDRAAAAQFIMHTAQRKGIYDIGRIRGRGAWLDAGRAVYHHGTKLSVDGEVIDITTIESQYVYELNRPLPMPADEPLSDEDGTKLLEIAKKFRWSKPGSAALLAGWVMLAPHCGAMRWRPHIWLTGGAGSGKTTVLIEYVHALMAGIDVFAQGNSTEPGIRQELKADARPVVIDESESNEESDVRRIQAMLSLIRQASTESQAMTYKGTAGGSAMAFHIRSMFCLASIQVALKHQADIERLTVLGLRSKRDDNDAAAGWKSLKEDLYTINRDPTIAARLFRRSLNLLPIIKLNIDIFSEVAANRFGSQREGDQYGTLLAGAWCMTSREVATPEQAAAMIDGFDWSEHRDNNDSDESARALSALMEAHIRTNMGDLTIYELVCEACGVEVKGVDMSKLHGDRILQGYGMRVKDEYLLISNTSQAIGELMAGTPFAADLRGLLLRVPGADRNGNVVVKFNGVASKCIRVPLGPIINEDDSPHRYREEQPF